MPLCLGASGSVRVSTKIQLAVSAADVQIFCPLITHSSPSSTARVPRLARSEPEPGSEYPWHQRSWPERMRGRKWLFWRSVPQCSRVLPTILIPNPSWGPPVGTPALQNSSATTTISSGDSPPPPYCWGHDGASSPFSYSVVRHCSVKLATASVIQGHQALPAGWEVLAEKGANLVPVVLDLRWVARIHGLYATAAPPACVGRTIDRRPWQLQPPRPPPARPRRPASTANPGPLPARGRHRRPRAADPTRPGIADGSPARPGPNRPARTTAAHTRGPPHRTSPPGHRRSRTRGAGSLAAPSRPHHDGPMDVLVVVDAAPVPERLVARARRRVDLPPGELPSSAIADLRAHIPRSVGVIGATTPAEPVADVARQLHRAGLPVTVYSDAPIDVEPGIGVEPLTDTGPADRSRRLAARPHRRHPARAPGPHRAGPVGAAVRQAGVPQPGRERQGPACPGHDRSGGAGGAATAGRHHRRADLGQHRGRTGHRGRSSRLPLHFHHAGQDRRREGGAAAGVRRRGGGLPHGRRSRTIRTRTTRWPAGWRRPRRAPSCPTSTPTRPTPRRTSGRPGRRSGGRRRGASPTWSPASARAGRSAGWVVT